MWIFTNGVNEGCSRLVGDAVYEEIRKSQAFRGTKSDAKSDVKLNVVGVVREDHLRYGENLGLDGKVEIKVISFYIIGLLSFLFRQKNA